MSLSLGNDKIQNNQHFEEGWNLVVPAWNQLVAPWNWVVPTWGGFCKSSTYKQPTEKILSDSNPRYHSWILGKPKLWTFDTWHPDLTTQEFQGGTKEFKARTRRFQGGTKEFRVEPGGWSPGFPILFVTYMRGCDRHKVFGLTCVMCPYLISYYAWHKQIVM